MPTSTLTKITIKIGENAKRTSEIERSGNGNPKHTAPQKLSEEEAKWVEDIIPNQRKADKWVIRELLGSCLHTQKMISKEEALEQWKAYCDIMNEKDVDQNKAKLKLEIQYDLEKRKNLKGLSKDEKRDIRANARKAEKLGIGKAKVEWWRRAAWNIADAWEAKDWKKMLPGQKETPVGIPETTSRAGEGVQPKEKYTQANKEHNVPKRENYVMQDKSETDRLLEKYEDSFHNNWKEQQRVEVQPLSTKKPSGLTPEGQKLVERADAALGIDNNKGEKDSDDGFELDFEN